MTKEQIAEMRRQHDSEVRICGKSPMTRIAGELLTEVERLQAIVAQHNAFVEAVIATEPHHCPHPTTEALLDKVKELQRFRSKGERLQAETAEAAELVKSLMPLLVRSWDADAVQRADAWLKEREANGKVTETP